jgi:hypothetical protein
MPAQIDAGARNTYQSDSPVVPVKPESLSRKPGGNEDTFRHGHQEQSAREKNRRGRTVVETYGGQGVIDGVTSPGDLPRAKINLPALLIKISEQKAQ